MPSRLHTETASAKTGDRLRSSMAAVICLMLDRVVQNGRLSPQQWLSAAYLPGRPSVSTSLSLASGSSGSPGSATLTILVGSRASSVLRQATCFLLHSRSLRSRNSKAWSLIGEGSTSSRHPSPGNRLLYNGPLGNTPSLLRPRPWLWQGHAKNGRGGGVIPVALHRAGTCVGTTRPHTGSGCRRAFRSTTPH